MKIGMMADTYKPYISGVIQREKSEKLPKHILAGKQIFIKVFLTSLSIAIIIFIVAYFPSRHIMMKSPNNTTPKSFSVLTANVGNLNLNCRDVLNKLCYKDVEEKISSNIKALNPDIIALQEVLAPWQCDGSETNRKRVCFDQQITPQARRLVGDNYTIVCNTRNQFECIAVKIDVGEIIGCDKGSICNSARTAPEVPNCDNGFTVSAATVKMMGGFIFDVVNFHPQSTNDKCRAKMISFAFEGTDPLIQQENVLLLGDFNFDPWRDQDHSTETWNRLLDMGWRNKNFTYHSGIAERNPPYYTSHLFYRKRSVDFVISNFAEGVCFVLGESPNTTRLDGGKGTDHRAVFGLLTVKSGND
jgi:endonuclease/exonuclease/phosphatase family metal-dependent hydrolase